MLQSFKIFHLRFDRQIFLKSKDLLHVMFSLFVGLGFEPNFPSIFVTSSLFFVVVGLDFEPNTFLPKCSIFRAPSQFEPSFSLLISILSPRFSSLGVRFLEHPSSLLLGLVCSPYFLPLGCFEPDVLSLGSVQISRFASSVQSILILCFWAQFRAQYLLLGLGSMPEAAHFLFELDFQPKVFLPFFVGGLQFFLFQESDFASPSEAMKLNS